jgi:Holliday junction resolvase-like predicted endonuclease
MVKVLIAQGKLWVSFLRPKHQTTFKDNYQKKNAQAFEKKKNKYKQTIGKSLIHSKFMRNFKKDIIQTNKKIFFSHALKIRRSKHKKKTVHTVTKKKRERTHKFFQFILFNIQYDKILILSYTKP